MKQKLLVVVLLIAGAFSAAGQNISLYKQFNGRYDFTFVGNTLNIAENNTQTQCTILTSSSQMLNLETTDVIEKAYIYWAGSGPGDLNISLNGQPVNAVRQFPVSYSGRVYFGAFADVTAIVQATGSGQYTVSDFDLTGIINSDPENIYCANGTNFGGWAIVVVFKNDELPLNQLNIYDGMQSVPDEVNITLNSLNVIDNTGARIGFIAWEGDRNLMTSETLSINDNLLSNALNPENNAFNGTNGVSGSSAMYNMDLDIYEIENNISVGDESADIKLTSGADYVMINTIITKLNSQLPDATVAVNNIGYECNSRVITVDYTVYNINSTSALPAEVPVSVYLNGDFYTYFKTTTVLPIGGSESGTITITLPDGVPDTFELLLVADSYGNGAPGFVPETDETNNTFMMTVTLWTSPPLVSPPNITGCDFGNGLGIFDFSAYAQTLKNSPTDTVTFYTSYEDAEIPLNSITNANEYHSVMAMQPIFIRLEDEHGCFSIKSFFLELVDCMFPDATVTIGSVARQCNSRIIIVNYTINNFNSQDYLPAGTPVSVYLNGEFLEYTETLLNIPVGGSESGAITLTIPGNAPGFTLTFTADDIGDGTGIVTESNEGNNSTSLPVLLFTSPPLKQPEDIIACDLGNNTGIGVFDFSAYLQTLKNSPDDIVSFYRTSDDAQAGTNTINATQQFTSSFSPQQVFVRLEDSNGCFSTGSFYLITKDCLFPDGSIAIGAITKSCNSRKIIVNYKILNSDSFDVLPKNTPIAIYADGVLLDIIQVQQDIPVNGIEIGVLSLEVPNGIPLIFNLIFTVDDTGNGTGIVEELNEGNNSDTRPVELLLSPVLKLPATVVSCNLGQGIATFDFSSYEEELKNNSTDVITFYTTADNALTAADPIFNITNFTTTSNPQTIYVRLDDGNCFTTGEFMLTAKKCPPETYNYITPNGDGVNDSFFVKGLRNVFLNFKMKIYNRWGNLVWTGDHSKADWDGIASEEKVGAEGTTVPAGTYYFVLELNDPDYPEPIVGWVYVTM